MINHYAIFPYMYCVYFQYACYALKMRSQYITIQSIFINMNLIIGIVL